MRWVLDSVLVGLLLAALLGGWALMRRTARRAQAQRQAAEAAAERRQRRLEVLAQLTLALSQQLDPDRLLQQITDALATLTGAHNVVLWEVDRAAGLLIRRAWTTDPVIGEVELPTFLTMAQGGTGWIARHREPLFVEDVATDERIMAAQWALSRDLVAFCGVPVAAGEELLGVLTMNLKRDGLPQGGDRTLLPAFAAQAAVAMRNARLFVDNTRLYEEARQRLRELQDTQAQLVQAAKLSALGQLVSGVAHELNNPLSVIIGYGQLLLSREVPDDARRPVELMVAQGDRMAKIVRSLLLFSRQRPPERRPVDLQDVVEQTLASADTQLTLSGILVETEFARGPAARRRRRPAAPAGVPEPAAQRRAGHPGQRRGGAAASATGSASPRAPADGRHDVGHRAGGRQRPRHRARRAAARLRAVLHDQEGRRRHRPRPQRVVRHRRGARRPPRGGERARAHGLHARAARGDVGRAADDPVAEGPRGLEPARAVGRGRRALVVEDEPAVVDLVVTLLDDQGWQVDVAAGGRAALERLRGADYDLVALRHAHARRRRRRLLPRRGGAQTELAERFLFITGDTANRGRVALPGGHARAGAREAVHAAGAARTRWSMVPALDLRPASRA